MVKKKKVAIVGSVGLPANYGGFETMVYYLTKQKHNEVDFTIFCQNIPKEERLKKYNGSKLIYLPLKANGAQSIIYDMVSIVLSWFKYDAILILGTGGSLIVPFLKLFKNTRTIVNFGGLEWKRDKWSKFGQWFLKLTEKIAIKNATIIVADNQYFCDYIREEYFKESVLIEYGGNHTKKIEINENLIEKYPFLTEPYDVSVSRAQVDNNLHMILDAYINLPNRNLVLISNYDKFEYGRALKVKYAKYPNLYLQDAVYNIYELDAIRNNAEVYVHSHTFCGTAPSLVESMSLGLPIISFKVPTNLQTTEEKALFFSDSSELTQVINSLTIEKEKELAISMKEIASRRYTWERISNKYVELF